MDRYMFILLVNGSVILCDYGYETEEDAEIAAKERAAAERLTNYEWKINQYWQELEYELPTQVIFYDTDLKKPVGGIAYKKAVICLQRGIAVDLDSIGILSELPWISLSDEVIGDAIPDEWID